MAFDKGFVVADDGDAESGDDFAVVVVNFGNGYIESALQPADYAFDDAAFFFQRADTVKVQVGCHHPDYHKQLSVVQADAVRNPLLFELQFGSFVFHARRRFIQPIGDFPGCGFLVVSSQIPQLGGRPTGFFSSADVHLTELFLHRNKRTFELARQHHRACGRIPLFQKRNIRFRVRPLYVWSFCDFSAPSVKVSNMVFSGSAGTYSRFANCQLIIRTSGKTSR